MLRGETAFIASCHFSRHSVNVTSLIVAGPSHTVTLGSSTGSIAPELKCMKSTLCNESNLNVDRICTSGCIILYS